MLVIMNVNSLLREKEEFIESNGDHDFDDAYCDIELKFRQFDKLRAIRLSLIL